MAFGVALLYVPRWPEAASYAQLPNVLGATVQSDAVRVGDVCLVTGVGYYQCTTPTAGAAVWVPLGDVAVRLANNATAIGTIPAGVNLFEATAAAGAITAGLPPGMPDGFIVQIVMPTANADGFTLSAPGAGTVQGGASILLPGSDAAPPTTADRAWQLRCYGGDVWRLA